MAPPSSPRTVAILGARIGSKGLPRKNLRLLAGSPLVVHTIRHAIESGVCESVILSTDSEELAAVGREAGAEVVMRPPELGEDHVPAEPVIQHALSWWEKEHGTKADIVVYLQTTDVFRTPALIAECVRRLAANPTLDSVFAGYKTHKNFWRKTPDGFVRLWKPTLQYESRQTAEPLYREDTGVACATRAEIVRHGGRIGTNVDIVASEDFETSIDIHSEFDLWLAEKVMSQWRGGGQSVRADWLGEDVKSWSQSIRNGYIRSFIIFALHETGVFEEMRAGTARTSGELASQLGLDAHLLEGTLNFLAHADCVVIKEGDRFSLTRRGREWLFSDPVLAMSFGAVGAYASLLYNLVDTLRGTKRYGRDFIRPGDLIAKGSYYTGKSNYPWVVEELRRLGVRSVADMGCGSADVLIGFCKLDPELKGVGIDIAPGALEEAGSRAKAQGLSDRIRLVQGDLTRPESYADAVEDVGAFNAIMVLHEFLRDGEGAVVEMLREMKHRFPGRYLIVGEFDRLSDDEFQAMPYPDRIHPLFYQEIIHPHTWQGLPQTKETWIRIFKEAGLEVVKVKHDFPFRLVEFVLRF